MAEIFDTSGFEADRFEEDQEMIEERSDLREAQQDEIDRATLEPQPTEEEQPQEQSKPNPLLQTNPLTYTSEDPGKPASEFGLKENVQEGVDVVMGVGRDLVADTLLLPERLLDLVTGDDKIDFDPLGVEQWQNSIKTETQWGKALRFLGGFAIPMTWGSKLAKGSKVLQGAMKFGQSGRLLGPVGRAITAQSGKAGVFGRAFRGGVVGETITVLKPDIKDEEGQYSNLFNTLTEFNPMFESLAIQETDSPMMRKVKNFIEGFGLGFITDPGMEALGFVGRKALGKIKPPKTLPDTSPAGKAMDEAATAEAPVRKAPDEDIREQITERGIQQLEIPGFNGFTNKPFADPGQGIAFTMEGSFDVLRQLNKIDNDPNFSSGSTGNIFTPLELKRIQVGSGAEAMETMLKVGKRVLGDKRVQKLLSEANPGTHKDRLAYSLRRVGAILSRDGDSENFWQPLLETADSTFRGGQRLYNWSYDDIVVADIVLGSLGKQIRDLSQIGLEVADDLDIRDTDSLLESIVERVTVGLIETKKARFLWSDAGKALNQLPDPVEKAKLLKEKFSEIGTQVTESTDLMLRVVKNAETDDVARAYMEAFAEGNFRTIEQLDNYMKTKLRAFGNSSGIKPGMLIREIQKGIANGVLSGPKTVFRAITGTATAAFMRPISVALGAALKGDFTTMRASLASTNAMIQGVPEAYKLFRKKFSAYMSGDVATYKNRFIEQTKEDQDWELLGDWIETRGSLGDKAAYGLANIFRRLNNNSLITYSPRAMAAGDDAFKLLMARSRAREKAYLKAAEELGDEGMDIIDSNLLSKYEDNFFNEIYDPESGVISEKFLQKSFDEDTLQTPLKGFSQGLETLMNSNPWTKPFFLFARTGINGLRLTSQYTPLVNRMLKENRAILKATTDTIDDVRIYNITNELDLKNAQALIRGREAIGTAVVFAGAMAFMNGNLRGNGPADRQRRNLWRTVGGDEYTPRQVKIGNVWVSYENIEPFGIILSTIADIGDWSQEMGEEWATERFAKLGMVIGQNITGKSYLQGLDQLMDIIAGEPQGWERTIGSIMNNTFPLSGLRNEMGKLLNPYMKELNFDIQSTIRSRNLFLEPLAGKDGELPIKYDILTGKPIQEYDFPTRMFNLFNIFNMNLDMTPGRKLLFDSGYDLSQSMTTIEGISLKDNPELRSKLMKAMGDQNLLDKLNKLAESPAVQESLAQMREDLRNGRNFKDPMSYRHNQLIKKVLTNGRKRAWALIKKDPVVQQLIEEDRRIRQTNLYQSRGDYGSSTDAAQSVLNLQNK